MLTKPSHQLPTGLPAQLGTSDIQHTCRRDDAGAEVPNSRPLSSSVTLQEPPRSTNCRSNGKQSQSQFLDASELDTHAELEKRYRSRNPLIERGISPDRGNQIASHYFSDALGISSTSYNTTLQFKSDNPENANTKKRRRTTIFDYEDVAIYTEAGKENQGFVSAKMYDQGVAKERGERGK